MYKNLLIGLLLLGNLFWAYGAIFPQKPKESKINQASLLTPTPKEYLKTKEAEKVFVEYDSEPFVEDSANNLLPITEGLDNQLAQEARRLGDNTLVTCETERWSCLPSEDPNSQYSVEEGDMRTVCITYFSNCPHKDSISQIWREEEVFGTKEEVFDPTSFEETLGSIE